MSFLFPLFLLGALGIAAPVWLHLRRRQRQNVVKFSALRFLDDSPSPRDMPLQLRDLLLFFLRMIALLLVVGAFAWPIFGGAKTTKQSETRIYLLDNTLSHRVDDGFQRARDDIARAIRRAGPETQTAVVEIAAHSRIVADFSMSHDEAAAAVEALLLTHQRGSYLDAFRLAATLLDRSLGSRRTILVHGDRQKNQWSENANVPPFLKDVEVIVPEASGKRNTGNLFTANTRTTRLPLRGGSAVNLTLDLGSHSVNRTADIVIHADGKEVLKQQIQLVAGQTPVGAQWQAVSNAWIRGEVRISGKPDVLPFDNHSFFAVPPLNPGKIALLARSPYLRASFDPEILHGFWDITVCGPKSIEKVAAADKPGFDAVVAESDFLQSENGRELILQHLNNGRGVLLFVSRRTPLVDGFLRTFGFRMGGEKTLTEDVQPFRYAALAHPALAAFASPDFGNLLGVRVKKYERLEIANAERANGLLYAGDGEPVLFETRGTKGKMLVFAFEMAPSATNWPLRLDFLPFLDQCLRYVRAMPEEQFSVEPGEMIFREFEGGAGKAFALFSGGTEAARAVADEHGRLKLTAPDQPGIYELKRLQEDGGTQAEGLLSVSPSAAESELECVNGRPAVLEAWILPPRPENAAADPTSSVAQTLDNQRLWWWLLAGGAAFLLCEMLWLLRGGSWEDYDARKGWDGRESVSKGRKPMAVAALSAAGELGGHGNGAMDLSSGIGGLVRLDFRKLGCDWAHRPHRTQFWIGNVGRHHGFHRPPETETMAR
ncbi:MAG TPA: BatA domain-containing protein [Chthoniobacterales bacterium]